MPPSCYSKQTNIDPLSRETWSQQLHDHVIKSSDHVIIGKVWRQNDLNKNFRRKMKLLHSLGNPCPMKLSDAWIPLKYLHHYSFLVWKLGTNGLLQLQETSNTFVGICPEQENTFKVLQQSFNSDLITRFCKCLRCLSMSCTRKIHKEWIAAAYQNGSELNTGAFAIQCLS